jgi:ATP-dependent Clp protease ATP-binding subunit ClpC
VVLFDEIEKAHTEVLNVLLQLFDDGRLTDGKGRLVDFTNTIIICTSNIGADLIRQSLKEHKSNRQLERDVMPLVHNHFRPEFVNRIDEIIVFHPLSKEQIKDIVHLQLERLRRTAHAQGLTLTFDETLIDHLAEVGFMPESGARELKRKIRSEMEKRLAFALLKRDVQEGDSVTIKFDQKTESVKIQTTKRKEKASTHA